MLDKLDNPKDAGRQAGSHAQHARSPWSASVAPTRIGSSSEVALRLALAAAAERGRDDRTDFGPAARPARSYDPSSDHRSLSARRLVQSLRRADASSSRRRATRCASLGMIKNALRLCGGHAGRPPALFRRPGCRLESSVPMEPRRLGTTLVSVRSIVHALCAAGRRPIAAAVQFG